VILRPSYTPLLFGTGMNPNRASCQNLPIVPCRSPKGARAPTLILGVPDTPGQEPSPRSI